MPSNVDLIAEAEALAEGLDITVDTGGLNNVQLVELVSDLKAQKKAAEDDAEPEVKVEPVEKAPFTLAKGKSLTTLRGILADGDAITIKDVKGGRTTIDKFVKLGYIDAN